MHSGYFPHFALLNHILPSPYIPTSPSFLLFPAQLHTPFSLLSHFSIFHPFPHSITYSLLPTFPLLHPSSFSPLNHLLHSLYFHTSPSFLLFPRSITYALFPFLSLPLSLKKINVFSTVYLCNVMMQIYNILHLDYLHRIHSLKGQGYFVAKKRRLEKNQSLWKRLNSLLLGL